MAMLWGCFGDALGMLWKSELENAEIRSTFHVESTMMAMKM